MKHRVVDAEGRIDMGKFDKFNAEVNTREISNEIKDIKENGGLGGNFKELEAGNYNVKVEKLVVGECGPNASCPGAPLLRVDMKVISGERKNHHIFMNKPLYAANPSDKWNTSKAIAQMVTWLNSLDSGLEVLFKSYDQFDELVMDIAEEISSFNYDVDYDPDAFIPITVTAVYDD